MRRKLLIPLIAILTVSFGGLIFALSTSTEPTLGLDLQGGISVTQQPVGDYDPAALDLAVEPVVRSIHVTTRLAPFALDPELEVGVEVAGIRGAAITEAPGANHVEKFVEKPDRAGAEALITDGALWNSGYFLFRADLMLAELEAFVPNVLEAARAAPYEVRPASR